MNRRAIALALAAIVAVGGGLRVAKALSPTAYTSADESAYATLATDLARHNTYGGPATGMEDPLRWPPGAPALFAAAHKLTNEIGPTPAYWAQALVGTLLILVVFVLAALLAGPAAGLAAAAVTALYPPLIVSTGDLLSEPLGALTLALAMLALAWALRKVTARGGEGGVPAAEGSAPLRLGALWPPAIPGVSLGLTILTRTDQLLLPFVLAAGVAVWAGRRWDRRAGLAAAGVLAAATLLTIAPWSIYASQRADRLVPVTTGGATPLFVGTYLPGDGTTAGLKRELGDEARAANPRLRNTPDHRLNADAVLDTVAARHPDLTRDAAIRREGLKNLVRYGLGDPLEFTAMALSKARRMWLQPFDGGRYPASAIPKALHNALLLLALTGLALGLWRARNPLLALIGLTLAYGTALHMLVVAQPRYNLPLMPLLFAAGAAGWVLYLQAGRTARTVSQTPPSAL